MNKTSEIKLISSKKTPGDNGNNLEIKQAR